MLKSKSFLILLLVIGLVPLLDFFHPGLPVTHDGQDHVARIANFYQSLTEGNLFPRWAGNLNWGYGHPILMFLYPLPSYFASFFHFLGFTLVDSTKIVFGLSFLLSGIFMYLWINKILGEKAGFAAGLVYLFAPYRFVDLYVRGAIGECWAFVWLPLICFFLYQLSHKLKWSYLVGGSLSLAFLILSHNALSLMFLLIIIGYLMYLVLTAKKKIPLAVNYFLLLILGFALSAFFWFPAVFESKYTLRDIVTKNQILGFEPINRLIWSPWNYSITGQFSVQVGIVQWLMIIIAPILIIKLGQKKNQFWLFLSFLFVCFWLSILLILPQAGFFYFKISLLQKFQFAWRWLSLAIFPPAIFTGVLIYLLPKRIKLLVIGGLLIAVLIANRTYWQAKSYLLKQESFYTQAYASPTDTGESAPIWSVRFMEKFPQARYEIIEGKAEINQVSHTTNKHVFEIEAITPVRIVDNTLYFPNWQVLVDDKPVEIQFQDPKFRGLITFYLPAGKHQVVVRFGETKLRLFADVVSLMGLISLVLGGIISSRFYEKT